MRTAAMMQQPLATQRASFPRTPDTTDLGFLCFHVDMRAVVYVLYETEPCHIPSGLVVVSLH